MRSPISDPAMASNHVEIEKNSLRLTLKIRPRRKNPKKPWGFSFLVKGEAVLVHGGIDRAIS
jgi:hypothetical protein